MTVRIYLGIMPIASSPARELSRPSSVNGLLAAKLLKKPVVSRELRPQDLKLELETMSREEAIAAANFLAAVVGRSHARQMSTAEKKNWKVILSRQSKSLDAPSWLWTSVVDLIAGHEAAYLEHCRLYALSSGAS